MKPYDIATNATLEALINSYVLETCRGEFLLLDEVPNAVQGIYRTHRLTEATPKSWLRIRLDNTDQRLWVPVLYKSLCGHNKLAAPVIHSPHYEPRSGECTIVPYEMVVCMIISSLRHSSQLDDAALDLERKIADSAYVLQTIFESRHDNLDAFFAEAPTFLAAEQALFTGHPLHPVAKSRIGMRKDDIVRYSPETQGAFQLHYFQASPEIVWHDSALPESAIEMVKELLAFDAKQSNCPSLLKILETSVQDALIPVHPLQVSDILAKETVIKLMQKDQLKYLGPLGASYLPTSSIRTVAHPTLPCSIKLSLGIEITNSKRINQEREMLRSIEAHSLLHVSPFAQIIKETEPTIQFMTDPGFLTVKTNGEVIEEMACTLRKHPFNNHEKVAVLAALTQRHPCKQEGLLARLVDKAARTNSLSRKEAALEWYRRFTQYAMMPLVRIYLNHGMAFESHQQNLVISIDSAGYPQGVIYRDNQGIFHRDTAHETLIEFHPGLGEESGSIGPEFLVDERLGYYLMINSAFGTASALAYQTDVDESELIGILRSALADLGESAESQGRTMIQYLLGVPALACKANLLTRCKGMDELIGDPRFQSVYLSIPNPLYLKPETKAWRIKDTVFDHTFQFREFDVETDLDHYHRWMNSPHVSRWWKLDKTKAELRTFLNRHQANPNHTLYMAFIDGKPVAYFERYWVAGDIFGKYAEYETFDQGIHFLIGEAGHLNGHTVTRLLIAFGRLCFEEESQTMRVIGEPDQGNKALLRHAETMAYVPQGSVRLPDKTAAHMVCHRTDHFERFGRDFRVEVL